MARANAKVLELRLWNTAYISDTINGGVATAIDATDGLEVVTWEKDYKYLFCFSNTAASEKNVVVKAGNSVQGVENLTISIPASSTVYIALESGKFKNVYGVDKEKIIITGDATSKVCVYRLP